MTTVRLPLAPTSSTDVTALLQVGDLARESGKTVRAIHLYEELGLLRPHARSKGRFRLFGQDALIRVRWIGKLQDLGLTSRKDLSGLLTSSDAALPASGVEEHRRHEVEEILLQATL